MQLTSVIRHMLLGVQTNVTYMTHNLGVLVCSSCINIIHISTDTRPSVGNVYGEGYSLSLDIHQEI
jgi:hypothetical protein